MFKQLFIIAGITLMLAACDPGYSTTGSNSPISVVGEDGNVNTQTPVTVEPDEPAPEPESCPIDTPSDPFCSDESHAACNCVPE